MPRGLLTNCLFLLVLVLATVGTTRGEVIERCDFEMDVCGWTNTGTGDRQWRRTITPGGRSGPPSGNGGTGFFVQLDGNDFKTTGSSTENGSVTLLSRSITPRESPACFRLFFYMWETQSAQARAMGNLTAGINSSTQASELFLRQGKQSANWTCGRFTIPNQSSDFQIFVTATVGTNSVLSDIAVDDFALFNMSCDDMTPEAICDPSASKPPASSTTETTEAGTVPSVPSSSTSTQDTQTSSTSSSAAPSSSLAPVSSTESPEDPFNTLVLLVIPAAVLLLAIPVAVYCYWRRRRRGPPIIFEPYQSRESMEVYDELGPMDGAYDYLREDYSEIKDVDLDDKPGEPQPPLPCRPRLGDPSGRALDTPPPEEEAPRRPSLSPAASDSKQQGGDGLQAGDGEGRATPNPYLQMGSQLRKKPGRPVSSNAGSYLEPVVPGSKGSAYLDATPDHLDPDDTNEGGQGAGNYLTPKSRRGASGRGDSDAASYVEPGTPTSRGSAYLDMENQAAAFSFPARGRESAPEGEDAASDYLDPDYINDAVESPGNFLAPRSRDQSGQGDSDAASYVEPGTPTSRESSSYMDMENQAAGSSFPARSRKSAPEGGDRASDYLDPDYINESLGKSLTPKIRISDNASDSASYVEPTLEDHAHPDHAHSDQA